MFTTLRRWFQKLKRTPYVRPENRFRARLRVEQLEDRVVPASISVNPLDVAPGSIATFTGTQFQTGENVNISLVADNGNSESFSVTDNGPTDLDPSDGNFAVEWLCDPNGAYAGASLTATATGDLGSSASTTFTDSISVGTPNLKDTSDTGSSNTDNITKLNGTNFGGNNLTFDITFSDAAAGTTHWQLIDASNSNAVVSATVDTTATLSGSVTLTVNSTLSDGEHNIKAKATGANTNTGSGLKVLIDTTGAVTIISLQDDSGFGNADNVTRDNKPGINVSHTKGSSGVTEIYDGATLVGFEIFNEGTTSQGVQVSLSEGIHALKAKEVDIAGNDGPLSAGYTLVVDTIAPITPGAPTVDINSPSAGQVTVHGTVGSLTVAGANPYGAVTTDGALFVPVASKIRLHVDGAEVANVTTTDGTYSFVYTPTPGNHTYKVEHEDRAGNSVGLSGGVVKNVVTTELVSLSLVAADATYTGSPYSTANITLTGPTATPDAPVGTTTFIFYADAGGTIVIPAPTNAATGSYWVKAHFASSDLAHWTNADSNIDGFDILKADATVNVSGYTGFYDAAAHGASGTVTGVPGDLAAAGSTLNLGAVFTNFPGGTANWIFTGGTNYNNQNGSVAITINKADATVNVSGYTGFYDAAAHGASGTVTGVPGDLAAAGSTLNLGAVFTNFPGGTANWIFTGGTNYNNQNGSVAITINKADATVNVSGYTGFYDAAAHGASGTVTGVPGDFAAAGSNLNLGAAFTNFPGGTANWTFTGGTNYNNQNGSVAITINQKALTVNLINDSAIFGTTPKNLATAQGGTTVNGVNGETLNIAYSTPGNVALAATGNYALNGVVSDGTGLLSNYNVTVNPGTFTVTPKIIGDELADASTQSALNISKAGVIDFSIKLANGAVIDNAVFAAFNGASFTLEVAGNTYSVTSVATVDACGVIHVGFRMSLELQNLLLAQWAYDPVTNASKAPDLTFSLSATSRDGNYQIDTSAITRLFKTGKLTF